MTIERTVGTYTTVARLTLRGGDGRLVDWCPVEELDAMRAERDAAIARAEREAAHAEQYKADWYAAKQEFGDAMAKAREREREAIARAERQAVELRAAQEQAERRNRELDALHYVWCNGGCDGGVHRWTDGKPDEQTVREAVRNTGRLVLWYRNAAAKRGEEPPDFGDATQAEVERLRELHAKVHADCVSAIARAERAERLCVRLADIITCRRLTPTSEPRALTYGECADVAAMRERVKP